MVLIFLFISHALQHFGIMSPAPLGVHGIYSFVQCDRMYKVKIQKDSLLHAFKKEGFIVSADRLNKYDPPWDSLRYLISNIYCGNQKIEPYIEFKKEKSDGFTLFQILWINAAPNMSYDTNIYKMLTIKYYNCFEDILKRNDVQLEINQGGR